MSRRYVRNSSRLDALIGREGRKCLDGGHVFSVHFPIINRRPVTTAAGSYLLLVAAVGYDVMIRNVTQAAYCRATMRTNDCATDLNRLAVTLREGTRLTVNWLRDSERLTLPN